MPVVLVVAATSHAEENQDQDADRMKFQLMQDRHARAL
jgi:hypothetical protein